VSDEHCYWTIDGVPACSSPHTWGPDIDPPFACAGSRRVLERMVQRFEVLRPGHVVEIKPGRCPEGGLGREGKWS
jgi:hypothetical protein